METLYRWLADGSKDFEWHARFITRIVAVNIIYVINIVILLTMARFEDRGALQLSRGIPWSSGDLFLLALGEEVFFRLMPIAIIVTLCKNRMLPEAFMKLLLLVTIYSSVAFGLAHGHVYNILIQGVCGFTWCVIFLKCGGMNGKYYTALLCSALAHTMYNIVVIGLRL